MSREGNNCGIGPTVVGAEKYKHRRNAAIPYVKGFKCMTHANQAGNPVAGKNAPDKNQIGIRIRFITA